MTAETRPAPALGRIAGVLVGGYLLAALLGALAVLITYARVPKAEISHGMAAFGMTLLYFVAFGGVSVVHSGLLIYWLRGRVRLWLLALVAAPAALACFVLGFFLMTLSA